MFLRKKKCLSNEIFLHFEYFERHFIFDSDQRPWFYERGTTVCVVDSELRHVVN